MINTSAKFDEEAHNRLVSIMYTILFQCMSIVAITFYLLHNLNAEFIKTILYLQTRPVLI